MARRTEATNWNIVVKDETGAMVSIDYECPYCGYSNAELISVGASNLDALDYSWETDQECSVCGKAVIVVCQ